MPKDGLQTDVNGVFYKVLYSNSTIDTIKLSVDNIKKYKLTYKDEDFESYIEETYGYIPPRKMIKKSENGIDIMKFVLPREGGTDKFKSQIKSTINNDKENISTVNYEPTKYMDVCKEESKNSPENAYGKIAVRDPKLMMEKQEYMFFRKSFFGRALPKKYKKKILQNVKKTMTPSTNGTKTITPPANGKKTVLPPANVKKTFTPLTNGTKTITPPVNGKKTILPPANVKKTLTPLTNGTKIITPPANGKKTVLPPANVKKTMTPPTNGTKTITPPANDKKTITSTIDPTSSLLATRENLSLSEIEQLYNKYFSKIIQDSIVILTNIINVISVSNKYHKSRMDESFKKRTEAEKLKDRCVANKLHLRHKQILEPILKKYFMDVITTFIDTEFEPAFQMFFLSILTVLRIVEQPKHKNRNIFKNLVLLLWNSLKSCGFEHGQTFTLLKSKVFRLDCINMISLIEDSQDSDPGIIDRMSFFFVSSVNTREYFNAVLDAVTGDSNEELGLLIDKAVYHCHLNSKFNDLIDYSSLNVKKSIITNKSPTTFIQNTIKKRDDEGVLMEHCVIAQNPNGTYQPIPMTNESQIQKSNNLTLRTKSESQPLNTYYETFSNSLLPRVSSKTATTKLIAPQASVVALPSAASTSSGSTATFKAFKPTIHNMTRIINEQHRLIRARPIIQRKALVTSPTTSNRNVIRRPPPLFDIKCFKSHCQAPATIMCSVCKYVKYCTRNCQKVDWVESHMNNCEQLKNIEQQRTAGK